MRPEKLRAHKAEAQLEAVMEGNSPSREEASAERAASDAEYVTEMLQSKGWNVIRKRLVLKNSMLWQGFVDPSVIGERATILRMQAMKYSGIEDIIEEILREGNKVQRREQ